MRRASGFTLMELMIALAVVAILVAIAYPSYVESIRKSRRTEAKTALLDLAARQERYFTTHNAYTVSPRDLGYGEAEFPIDVRVGGDAYYRLDMQVPAGAAGWGASADPSGPQRDDRCGSFTIDHLGITGNAGGSLASTQCW